MRVAGAPSDEFGRCVEYDDERSRELLALGGQPLREVCGGTVIDHRECEGVGAQGDRERRGGDWKQRPGDRHGGQRGDDQRDAGHEHCANLSFRRELLVSLGGFREDWPRRLGGDDVELGMRVNASGFAILCRPSALVRHDRGTWARWGAVAERAWRWGAMDVHVRTALPPGRLVPAGAGPEFYATVLSGGALLAAIRRRHARPLLRALLVLPCALVLGEPPLAPFVAGVSGAALRLIFAVAALAEALRVKRPGVALLGLAPVERSLAARRARRRTAVTLAGLMLTLPWVTRAPRAPRRG